MNVPLERTFTPSDVAVANSYSKSVLRAAVEPFVAGRDHIEYFPSYESVLLTDRSIAFVDDQVHIDVALVRFNVDRMINRYVKGASESTATREINVLDPGGFRPVELELLGAAGFCVGNIGAQIFNRIKSESYFYAFVFFADYRVFFFRQACLRRQDG